MNTNIDPAATNKETVLIGDPMKDVKGKLVVDEIEKKILKSRL